MNNAHVYAKRHAVFANGNPGRTSRLGSVLDFITIMTPTPTAKLSRTKQSIPKTPQQGIMQSSFFPLVVFSFSTHQRWQPSFQAASRNPLTHTIPSTIGQRPGPSDPLTVFRDTVASGRATQGMPD